MTSSPPEMCWKVIYIPLKKQIYISVYISVSVYSTKRPGISSSCEYVISFEKALPLIYMNCSAVCLNIKYCLALHWNFCCDHCSKGETQATQLTSGASNVNGTVFDWRVGTVTKPPYAFFVVRITHYKVHRSLTAILAPIRILNF